MKTTSPVAPYRPTIYIDMGLRDELRDFLRLPRKDRRSRSEPSNEAGSSIDPRGADLGVPRPTESTPDLRISASKTLPTSSPSTPHDCESSGT